ncbi:MAG TPA: DUF1761 domain-containing protein [Bacteroidia bacterium]|jgi:hypothetical protein|nr:DUF1761 domain-containing protein [Bacteroidia bacterium]
MILEHLNYLPIAVAALAYFAIGSVWFSPVGFSKAWMQGHNITMPTDEETKKKMMKEMPKYMLFSLTSSFVGAVVLAALQGVIGINGWMAGVKLGLAAAAFIFIAFAQSHMYTRKSFKLLLIDSGYHIVGLVLASVILSVWK